MTGTRHVFGHFEYKNAYGVSWLKLFYHHMENIEEAFDNIEDATYIIGTNQYSILSEVQKWPHSGPYEFLLEYPEHKGFNRWKQTNFPLNEVDYEQYPLAKGYENVSISWTDYSWGGLLKSNDGCSLLEGSIGTFNWFYAIGTKKNCAQYGIEDFPGPGTHVHTVYLWMKVPRVNLETNYAYIRFKYCVSTFIFFLS